MRCLLLLLILLSTGAFAQNTVVTGESAGASTNPTSGTIPYNNAGVFADSPLSRSGANVVDSGSMQATSFISTGSAADAFTARADTACVVGNWWFSSSASPSAFRYCDGNNVLRTVPLAVIDSPTTYRALTCFAEAANGNFQCSGSGSGTAVTLVGTVGSTNATASAPPFLTETTTAINTPVGWRHAANDTAASSTLDFFTWSQIGTAATLKQFHGYSDQTIAVMGAADVPAGNYVGIFGNTTGTYTGLTDTTHYVCASKNGTTQTAVVSTVLFDSGLHTFEAREASGGGSWTFFIDGVASGCGAITTTLPASGTLLAPMEAFEVTAGGNFAIAEAKWRVESAH